MLTTNQKIHQISTEGGALYHKLLNERLHAIYDARVSDQFNERRREPHPEAPPTASENRQVHQPRASDPRPSKTHEYPPVSSGHEALRSYDGIHYPGWKPTKEPIPTGRYHLNGRCTIPKRFAEGKQYTSYNHLWEDEALEQAIRLKNSDCGVLDWSEQYIEYEGPWEDAAMKQAVEKRNHDWTVPEMW